MIYLTQKQTDIPFVPCRGKILLRLTLIWSAQIEVRLRFIESDHNAPLPRYGGYSLDKVFNKVLHVATNPSIELL